jgi:hypothetical protein
MCHIRFDKSGAETLSAAHWGAAVLGSAVRRSLEPNVATTGNLGDRDANPSNPAQLNAIFCV